MTKSFDHLLRETLAADVSANCLDAESIAAWFDNTLSRRDRKAAEAHVANCVRCQAMLAAMARTAAPQVAGHRLYSLIRWVAPLTVAAAVVLVWINMPERAGELPNNATTLSAPTAENVPQNQERATSSLDRAAPLPADRRQPPPSRTRAARNDAVAKREPARADAIPQDSAKVDSLEAAASAPAPQARPAPSPAQGNAAARAETVVVAGSAPVAVPMRAEVRRELLDSSNGSTRWRIAATGAAGSAALRGAGDAGSPESNVQRSIDGGRTWETLTTGVTATLTAAASPSPMVCWVVGRAGVVLLTTDARTWQRIDFPESVDLVSVLATDDRTASITTVDGRTFRTTNRGGSWERGER